MTKAEEDVIQWACNLTKAVVAGDYKLPRPMNIAINSLQDAVNVLADERGWRTISEGCDKTFLAREKEYWDEIESKLRKGV